MAQLKKAAESKNASPSADDGGDGDDDNDLDRLPPESEDDESVLDATETLQPSVSDMLLIINCGIYRYHDMFATLPDS